MNTMQSARIKHQRQGHEALYFKLSDADTHAPRVRKGPAVFSFHKLIFQVSGGVEFVDPTQVCFLKAESNYTCITEITGRTILLSKTLKECVKVFPGSFLRIHQSYLINPSFLVSYDRKRGQMRLEDQQQLPVSRSGKVVMQAFLASQDSC